MIFGQRANGDRFEIRVKIGDFSLRQKKFAVDLGLDLKFGIFFWNLAYILVMELFLREI